MGYEGGTTILRELTINCLVLKWSRHHLLIIDEVGYFPSDELTATIFFQVVFKRYEKMKMGETDLC